ncbi:hypothetical protein MAIC_47440 [Mycolicibacterium aichiense]|uniref:Uncharacterized protein n=1 Tax=Mycolicibacterium aichiense TaxID=1799 RepID=A0AAD1HRY5_9MYCO|nr:hypothetical protein MAIC_47440 [Mycolicibacterium aichiense]STZ26394.1 Uncharacterised protein [Mycolicibacterium aichiense]
MTHVRLTSSRDVRKLELLRLPVDIGVRDYMIKPLRPTMPQGHSFAAPRSLWDVSKAKGEKQ